MVTKDMNIQDIVKLLSNLKAQEIVIQDLNGEVFTKQLEVEISQDNKVTLTLPFATNGLHEWRNDVAEKMYH